MWSMQYARSWRLWRGNTVYLGTTHSIRIHSRKLSTLKTKTHTQNLAKGAQTASTPPQADLHIVLAEVAAIFFVTHIAIYLLAIAGSTMFTGEMPPDSYLWMGIKPSNLLFLRIWERWDSIHYISILENGYTYFKPGVLNTAFFPLYPLLGYLLNSSVVHDPTVSLMLVSNCASFGGLVYVYKLVAHEYGQEHARRAILYISIFPNAFVLVGLYTESLFLLNLAATLYYARTQRWGVAAVWGVLLTATRLVGVAALPALLWEYMSQRDWKWRRIDWRILSIGAMTIGLLSYMTYTYFAFGDFFSFVHSSTAGWNRHPAWPWVAWIEPIRRLGETNDRPMVLFTTLFGVLGLVLTILSFRRLRASYVILGALLLIIPFASNQAGGIPRYVLTNIPLFILLSKFGNNRIFHLTTMVFFLLFLALFTILHANWLWVG